MRHIISKQFKHPGQGLFGVLVSKFFIRKNVSVEKLACQLCDIKPDHEVLEVGFGPGIGLKEAFDKVSGGSGSIHGIDISQKSFNLASEKLKQEINSGKLKLHLGSVTEIPYADSSFDSIFHTNCFYFWPNMDEAITELHRVIKPDGVMVATMVHQRMRQVERFGLMQYGNIDPDRYMTSLEKNGFYDINMKTIPFEKRNITALTAKAKK